MVVIFVVPDHNSTAVPESGDSGISAWLTDYINLNNAVGEIGSSNAIVYRTEY